MGFCFVFTIRPWLVGLRRVRRPCIMLEGFNVGPQGVGPSGNISRSVSGLSEKCVGLRASSGKEGNRLGMNCVMVWE